MTLLKCNTRARPDGVTLPVTLEELPHLPKMDGFAACRAYALALAGHGQVRRSRSRAIPPRFSEFSPRPLPPSFPPSFPPSLSFSLSLSLPLLLSRG